MKEIKVKVLTHCGSIVDSQLLDKGIYTAAVPQIFEESETIDSFSERGRQVSDMAGFKFLSESYFENLSQCEMTPATLIIDTTKI